MVRHEERDYRVRLQMLDLSAGESRTSEASKVASAIADSCVEVGAHHHGLRRRLASYVERA